MPSCPQRTRSQCVSKSWACFEYYKRNILTKIFALLFQNLLTTVTVVLSLQCLVSSSTSGGRQSLSNVVLHRQARQLSPTYDQCNHAFHKFLCNPAPRPRKVTPEAADSFPVKQVAKPSAPVPAPSFGVKIIAAPPDLQRDSSSNVQKQTNLKPLIRPTEATIEDLSFVNCQQHTSFIKPSTTQKTIVVLGESSFARESKLAPEPYLPPPESPSPAPTFLQPLKLSLPLQSPTKEPESTTKAFTETYPKPSATFVKSENIQLPFQNKKLQTTPSPIYLSPKSERPLLEGQAASAPESIIPTDNEVDNCKHSFHSFLCTPSSSRRRRPFNNSRKPPVPSLTGESTFENPSKLLPLAAQSDSQINITSTTKTVEIATKPLIRKPPTIPRPVIIPVTRTTEPKISAEADQSPVQIVALQDQKQPSICKDAFHSFLCQPINTSRRRQKYGERYQSSATRTSESSFPLRGDSSFNQPSKVLPNFNQPRIPVTSSTSLPSYITPRADSLSEKSVILCNHTEPPQTTNKPSVIASNTSPPIPIPIPRPDSTHIQPARLPFPTIRPTTVRTPQAPIRNVAAAQTPDVSVVRPNHDHGHDHSHDHGHGHDHHGIDICKDPFHSFLCTAVVPSKRKRPTGELPARFRNPEGSKFVGASSFNQPIKLLPSDTKRVTIRPPVITTESSVPPKQPNFSAQELDTQPQPAQTTQAKLQPQTASEIPSKNAYLYKNGFHILCERNKSTTISSTAHASPLYSSNLKGDTSFVSPSKKVLPFLNLDAQGTENGRSEQGYEYPKSSSAQVTTPTPTPTKHPGYVYNPPSKPLQYPNPSLRADSTFIQSLKTVTPNNLRGLGTENREFLSGFNEFPGYSYQKPSKPLQYPTSTLPPTTKSVTLDNNYGQGTADQENSQGYNYPKPNADQQLSTHPPSTDSHVTFSTSGYNYPIPEKYFQYPDPLQASLIGEGSKTEFRKALPSVSVNGQNLKENIYQTPLSNNPYPPFTDLYIQPRPFAKTGAATNQTCDHTLPQRTSIQTPPSSTPPSPSKFVRGLPAAASVLAASNELPEKCNHPFLGYVCKRSSNVQIHKK